jgi:hypothetical protein
MTPPEIKSLSLELYCFLTGIAPNFANKLVLSNIEEKLQLFLDLERRKWQTEIINLIKNDGMTMVNNYAIAEKIEQKHE